MSGGCRFIQVREKSMSDRNRLALLNLVIERAAHCGAWVVANDRADLAVLSGADGLHLGQSDLAIADARRLPSHGCRHLVIGQSVGSAEEAILAESEGADYAGCGSVFATDTKQDAVEIGLGQLSLVADSVDIPVFGIGGICLDNVGNVLSAGAFGVAICSAIVADSDPGRATREFIAAIDRAS